MAKARNLAGLAALGALGYMMTRKQDGSDDRGDMPRGVGMGESAEAEYAGRPAPAVRPSAAPVRATAPATPAALPQEVPSRGRREMLKNPQRGPSFEEITAHNIRTMGESPSRGRREMLKNPQRGPSFEEIQQKNEQDRIDALRASGGMRAKGGAIKMASGGSVSSASKRADGIAQRGKTKGRIC